MLPPRVYQRQTSAVSGGTVGVALVDKTWYDLAGNVVKSLPAGADLHQDGLRRPIFSEPGPPPDATLALSGAFRYVPATPTKSDFPATTGCPETRVKREQVPSGYVSITSTSDLGTFLVPLMPGLQQNSKKQPQQKSR